MLTILEMAAALLAATAAACLINAKALKLPVAVGTMIVGLAVTALVAGAELLRPDLGAGAAYGAWVGRIDYPKLVLDFLLAYLLFAGAMNVNLTALARRGWAVAVLATLGTVVTAGLMAGGFWLVARLVGYDLPVAWAVVFGTLISPTDPIAVLAMTKRTALDEEVRAQLEGEALFNDGVAVVLFRAALAFAVAQGSGAVHPLEMVGHVATEALGGALLGLVGGVVAVAIIYAVDDWGTELLITLAVATGVYALAGHLHLSGPIGVVCAGLVAGSKWARGGMAEPTRRYVFPFWHMVDEAMNAVLFFVLGLVAWNLKAEPGHLWLAAAAPALLLAARWIAIALPSAALPLVRRRASVKLINVLTWAGVRGGLSAAMALSLPESPQKQMILAGTLGVVVFSMIVQSMTMEGLAVRTGYGVRRAQPEPTH
jgi:CPA1 family monovalent cation:H+ antiporter